MRLGPDHIVAPDNVVMFQTFVDVNLSLKELEAGGAEIFEFNDLDGKALHGLALLDALVDTAAVPLPQDLIKEHLVFADLHSVFTFFARGLAVLVTAHTAEDGLGD